MWTSVHEVSLLMQQLFATCSTAFTSTQYKHKQHSLQVRTCSVTVRKTRCSPSSECIHTVWGGEPRILCLLLLHVGLKSTHPLTNLKIEDSDD
jgi:hypothetical protein